MKTPARRGSVLVVVLWVTLLLSLFVAAFAFDMEIQSRITSAWRKKLKAEALARGGIGLAQMAMLETYDPGLKDPDKTIYLAGGEDKEFRNGVVALAQGGGATFAKTLPSGEVAVSIQPENAKINVNSLIDIQNRDATYENWRQLFDIAGVTFDQRDALVDCLIDWVDPDEAEHLNGAESSYYESLTPPYSACNGPLATVEDLMLIKGFAETVPETGRTVYESVAEYLTTYAENEKININAVSAETLTVLFNMDPVVAEWIVNERLGLDGEEGTADDKPFADLNDLLARVPALDPAIGQKITFSSAGRFRIRSVGQSGGLRHVIDCIAYMADKQVTFMKWLEGAPESEPALAAAESPAEPAP
jgi:general secretion pathway protein K